VASISKRSTPDPTSTRTSTRSPFMTPGYLSEGPWARLVVRIGQNRAVAAVSWAWPESDQALVELQGRLANAAASALATEPWLPSGKRLVLGGCFVAYARGGTGPGQPGDEAWAAAVAWRGDVLGQGTRRTDHHLRGAVMLGQPRQADDVLAQSIVASRVASSYLPGLLARREGAILAAAVAALDVRPELLLVDASGLDHPRGAGLAIHLGAVADLPTVGVTRQPLVAVGDQPDLRRGSVSPLVVDGRCVAFWVCTRTGARPIVAHAGWRTSPETASRVVLDASTQAARTPVPLQEARRVAREARSLGLSLRLRR
jgi:deoxyribonuclease V